MSYAIRNDGQGWRAVNGPQDVGADETFSANQPAPIWSKAPALSTVRAARELVLNRIMGIAFAADKASDAATVTACLAARTALLNITAAAGVASATDDASLKTALVAAYAAIVAAAPSNVRTAFAEFNL